MRTLTDLDGIDGGDGTAHHPDARIAKIEKTLETMMEGLEETAGKHAADGEEPETLAHSGNGSSPGAPDPRRDPLAAAAIELRAARRERNEKETARLEKLVMESLPKAQAASELLNEAAIAAQRTLDFQSSARFLGARAILDQARARDRVRRARDEGADAEKTDGDRAEKKTAARRKAPARNRKKAPSGGTPPAKPPKPAARKAPAKTRARLPHANFPSPKPPGGKKPH